MQPFMGPPFGSLSMQPMNMHHSTFMHPSIFNAGPQMSHMGALNPAFGQGGGAMGLSRGGGLLARLFGGGQMASASPFSSMLGKANGLSGMNLSMMLQNAQRVLGITQQVVPMIQQYGPLIRNMPTIWRIMRSSSDSPTTNSTEGNIQDATSVPIDDDIEQPVLQTATSTDNPTKSLRKTKPNVISGLPAPKLYV